MAAIVAPVRERGLKSRYYQTLFERTNRRTREGAWIEIAPRRKRMNRTACRSRKGAWIEIDCRAKRLRRSSVAPARERGLKC